MQLYLCAVAYLTNPPLHRVQVICLVGLCLRMGGHYVLCTPVLGTYIHCEVLIMWTARQGGDQRQTTDNIVIWWMVWPRGLICSNVLSSQANNRHTVRLQSAITEFECNAIGRRWSRRRRRDCIDNDDEEDGAGFIRKLRA